MVLKRPKNTQGGSFEQPTDPALDVNNGVNSLSKWYDNSYSPARLYERNAANTAWSWMNAPSGYVPLGRHTDVFTATLDQTSFVLTYTPASQADIESELTRIPGRQDPANITGLAGKTVTVITGLLAGESIAFTYTRLD